MLRNSPSGEYVLDRQSRIFYACLWTDDRSYHAIRRYRELIKTLIIVTILFLRSLENRRFFFVSATRFRPKSVSTTLPEMQYKYASIVALNGVSRKTNVTDVVGSKSYYY